MKAPTPPGKCNLPYIQSFQRKNKKGKRVKWVHYFRSKKLPHPIPMPDDHESAAFHQLYAECLARLESEKAALAPTIIGTFGRLVEEYRDSPDFKKLRESTRKEYDRHIGYLLERFAALPVKTMPREVVIRLRDHHAATPRKANWFIQIMSILMNFAVDRGYRAESPVRNIKKLKLGTGSNPWSFLDLQRFRRVAPLDLQYIVAGAFFTGQRQQDLIDMNWSQLEGGGIVIKQAKTGEEVFIPIHPLFMKILDAMNHNDRDASTPVFRQANGGRWDKRNLISQIRRYTKAAKLDGITFHGLRKSATASLADAGCSERQIMSITGHKTSAMVSKYLGGSTTKKRAQRAIDRQRSVGLGGKK